MIVEPIMLRLQASCLIHEVNLSPCHLSKTAENGEHSKILWRAADPQPS